MSRPAWLGIDIGGTHFRLVLIDGSGMVIANRMSATRAEQGPSKVIAHIADAVGALNLESRRAGHDPVAVGVGCAGVIDGKAGAVLFAPNLPGWRDIPLAADLSTACGLPVVLGNDANCYAVGERHFGAGRDSRDLMCFTLGTGVGGGLIIDDRLITGPLGTGGEVGHLVVEPGGRKCGCGAQGCVEAYASSTGLEGLLGEALEAGRETRLQAGDDPQAMAGAARRGDELAGELFNTAGRTLGRAMAAVVVITGVDLMIIGGGMAVSWDLMEPAARAELDERLRMTDAGRVRMIPGELGQKAGALGAAQLARLAHGEKQDL